MTFLGLFYFYFILLFCIFFGVFDEMLVGWLDWYIDDDDMMFLV